MCINLLGVTREW